MTPGDGGVMAEGDMVAWGTASLEDCWGEGGEARLLSCLWEHWGGTKGYGEGGAMAAGIK